MAEQQGHGHTADIARPISYEQMADDSAALLEHLGIEQADVVGYSMGGGIALQFAIRHPARVRRLVVASASYTYDGMHAAATEMFPTITPELFAGSPMEEEYVRVAPNPGDFPNLVEKLVQLDSTPFDWADERSRDHRTHADRRRRLRRRAAGTCRRAIRPAGGGVMGDLAGMPTSQLAVLPGTSHFIPPGCGVIDRADWLLAMIPAFLDPAEPAAG